VIIYPIHHENIAAKTASEDDGVGHFDVIEWSCKRYQVIQGDGGAVLHEGYCKNTAVRIARREARKFDKNSGRMVPGRVYPFKTGTIHDGLWAVARTPTMFETGPDGLTAMVPSKRQATLYARS
jgi:hypothetical protein